MKISRVSIQNYRNITNVSIPLFNVTRIIGNNNSGKSNFLKAVTLPLLSEDIGSGSKSLSWTDLGNESKRRYYSFINNNLTELKAGKIDLEDFSKKIPFVSVKIDWFVPDDEKYAMQEFVTGNPTNKNLEYSLAYEFRCKSPVDLLKHIIHVVENIKEEQNINDFQQNLLPIEMFHYSIFIPEKNQGISFDKLKYFKYNAILAERDEFSSNNSKIGSKSLIQILNKKIETENLMEIERQYAVFFKEIQSLSKMEEILNWQELTDLDNAKDFFSKISILPNMPPMTSLLSGVKLGYDEVGMSSQGLGYRNLILQLVLMNSMIEASQSLLSLLTIEEPEAHLCYRNEQLLMSYIKTLEYNKKNLQLIYSTHSTKFIDKLDLGSVILFDKGNAYSFSEIFDADELSYLSKNPNLDIFKLFYSTKCVLVEGISEEFLIKSFLQNQKKSLNEIEVISFHKGFKTIINLWLKINKDSTNQLGIIRDFDNQENAKKEHEVYNSYKNVFVETTSGYTLEDDIVGRDGNYSILKDYFEQYYQWDDISTPENLVKKWKNSKAEIMFRFCQDLATDSLKRIKLPLHVETVLSKLTLKEFQAEKKYEN